MFVIDTNVISELRLPRRTNHNVAAWTRRHNPGYFYLSVATVLELQYGALNLARRDKAAGDVLLGWITEQVLPDFADRILPATTDIALACARLHVPNRRSDRDAWIAATALVHNLTVVTRNTKDFAGTGVKLFNPWNSPT